jgi:transcriptional regulator with XRE-family HTH domain
MMTNQIAYPTLWFSSAATAALVLAVGMQVGTGGVSNAAYYRQRGEKGYAFAHYEQSSLHNQSATLADQIRTPVEALAHIRAVLKPSVTDLAHAMKVSRQAVYDWQNGKPMAPENASRLGELADAADILADAGITSTRLLRRPITSGKTLFDIARDGGSPEPAARKLVLIIRRELGQRQKLMARLKDRVQPDTMGDYEIAPALDETV